MRLLHVSHPAGFQHDTGPFHPERPARLKAAHAGIALAGVEVEDVEAVPIDPMDLVGVHSQTYVEAVRRFCEHGGGNLDLDTVASRESWPAALAAAGAGLTAAGRLGNGFDGPSVVTVRPPGHHALFDQAMGFCLFNNVAVAAHALREQGHRVAIVDWDVHHGNGTQATFYDDPDVLYVSIHQHPFYPFEGASDEVGEGSGRGTTINVPLPAFTAGDVYLEAFDLIAMTAVRSFRPDWLLVSAGYDAHANDPLAELRLTEGDYATMAASLVAAVPADRTVLFLEGGYHLPAIRDSLAATARGLLGLPDRGDPSPYSSPPESQRALERVHRQLQPYLDG